MEVKRLEHLNINANVTSEFSLTWSEDNKIAVGTSKGIYILALAPDCDSDKCKLPFDRTLIELTNDSPSHHTNIYTDDLVAKLNRLDAHRLILESSLAPQLKDADVVQSYVTQIAWSPAGVLQHSRCLLAALTNLGQVTLYVQNKNTWQIMSDITRIWATHCKTDWSLVSDTESVNVRFKMLETRISQLRSTAIAWGQCDSPVTSLVTAQHDNTIVVFSLVPNGTVEIKYSILTGLDHISTMLFVGRNILALGDKKGQVKQITLPSIIEKVSNNEIVKCSNEENIWADQDLLAISSFVLLHHAFVAAKGCYLLIVPLIRPANSDISVISHPINCIKIGGTARLNDNSVIIITISGEIHVVTVHLDANGLKISKERMASNDVLMAGSCGITASKSRAIWAILAQRIVPGDLTTVLTLFHIDGLINPLSIMENKLDGDLENSYDQLELIRIAVMLRRTGQTQLLPNILLPALPDSMDHLTMYQLKRYRWIARIQRALIMREEQNDEIPMTAFPQKINSMDAVIANVDQIVVIKNACLLVNAMTRRYEDQQLPVLLLESLFLLRTFLSSFNGSEELYPSLCEEITSALALSTPREMPAQESCTLCGKDSLFNTWQQSSCVLGHHLPRCMITMLQTIETPLLVCHNCKHIANIVAQDIEKHSDASSCLPSTKCVFCDSSLELSEG